MPIELEMRNSEITTIGFAPRKLGNNRWKTKNSVFPIFLRCRPMTPKGTVKGTDRQFKYVLSIL